MTMSVKVENTDSNPHRALRVEVVPRDPGFPSTVAATLRPGESAVAWVHSGQDLRLSEVEAPAAEPAGG